MSATHAAQALVDFDTLVAETGAGDVVLSYLRARGLARTAALALVEPDETRFKATVVDPLIAGFRDEATNVAPGDQPSARAILLHMFLEARSQWDAWSASRAAALSPNTGTPAGASTAPAPAMLNLPSPPAGPPSKSFEAWGPLVQAYNAKLLDGKPRQFPTRQLAGADAILARICHEHTVSKAYTPLMLGEILAARTWTSADELNKLASGGRDALAGSLQVVGGAVVAAEEKKPWQPRKVMAVLDGLEAVRLAWVLTGLGDEEDVDAYIAWWDKKARARNVNIEALVQYWTSTATTLAMEMRQRRTFKEVTSGVMSDISAFLEAMSSPPPRPEPKGKTKVHRRGSTPPPSTPLPPPLPRSSRGRRGEGSQGRRPDERRRQTPGRPAGPTSPGKAPRRRGGRAPTPIMNGRPVRAAAANPRKPAGSARANGNGARDSPGPWPTRRLRNPTSLWPNTRVLVTALAGGTSFCSPPSTALGRRPTS